jgi:hypothetical protein
MRPRTALVLTFLLFPFASVAAQADRVAAALTKLMAEAGTVLPEQSRSGILARLDRARAALASGDIYLALYDLQPGFEVSAGYRLAATAKAFADHAAFERKWKAMGPPAAPPPGKAGVTFVEALAQSAEGRAPATYRASLPYAQDAGLQAGLYYLAESHAMVEFAALCRSLSLTPAGRGPNIGSIGPALTAYEQIVVKSYDRAPAAQRPQYAFVSVAIKLARTLDEQGRHEGALLQYLVSRYRYGLIRAAEGTAPAGDLENRIKGARVPGGVDHSIADFFLQLARATSSGQSATPASATIILDDILPAYFAVVKS